MTTHCKPHKLSLEGPGRRRLDVDFTAGHVTSDAGAIALAQVDRQVGLFERIAACFKDHRNPDLVEHSLPQLLRQRGFGLVQGYEDLNDHEQLSRDPLLAMLAGKDDVEGRRRVRKKDQGKALASPSTLGRIERTRANADSKSRYEKVVCDFEALRTLFVDIFIERQESTPTELILDLDPSDIALHGTQEDRFFHGYYRNYCYLPMYLYCGQYPLAVELRPSNIDGAKGAKDLIEPVVARLRARWPEVRVIIRGDSGFCRNDLMSWCETNKVDYVIGVARNSRLVAEIESELAEAKLEHEKTGKASRRFRDFRYRTLETWSRTRRVVGKAEHLSKGANPRFVVTTLSRAEIGGRELYEDVYCARGEMENRIKEQQLDLFGDRASSHTFRGNEVRVWLSLAAHLLVVLLRELALKGTELFTAQASTLRSKLLKIGAVVTVSVRRVYVQISSAYPLQPLLIESLQRLQRLAPAPG